MNKTPCWRELCVVLCCGYLASCATTRDVPVAPPPAVVVDKAPAPAVTGAGAGAVVAEPRAPSAPPRPAAVEPDKAPAAAAAKAPPAPVAVPPPAVKRQAPPGPAASVTPAGEQPAGRVKPRTEPPAKAPAKAPAEPVAAPAPAAAALSDLQQLPLAFGGLWELDVQLEGDGVNRCVLQAQPGVMDDGQGGTPVTLLVYAGQLVIRTQSNIDSSYDGDGLEIAGHNYPLQRVSAETNLVFADSLAAIYQAMARADAMTLRLGFWPTWPQTQVYAKSIPLQHFEGAYQALLKCGELLGKN